MCEYILSATIFTIIKYRKQRYPPAEREKDDGIKTVSSLLCLIILIEELVPCILSLKLWTTLSEKPAIPIAHICMEGHR